MHKIKIFFQERWKYFLGCYLLGYVASLLGKGVPDLSYYIPIKLFAFFCAWAVGNGLYENREDKKKGKFDLFKTVYNSLKYGISGVILCIPIWLAIVIITSLLGISRSPFTDI